MVQEERHRLARQLAQCERLRFATSDRGVEAAIAAMIVDLKARIAVIDAIS
jgi:hypothetical protein